MDNSKENISVCGKIGYKDKKDAEIKCVSLFKRLGRLTKVYQCKDCLSFHLTKNDTKIKLIKNMAKLILSHDKPKSISN